MTICSIDWETRGTADLPKVGAHKYVQDPATGIYMLGWAFDDEPVSLWLPSEPFPQRIIDHVQAGGLLSAHNAQFERLVWWYILSPDFDVPEPAYEQFRCTAARARAHGLPGSLGDCARALELPALKQAEGARLITDYSIKNVPWVDIPAADQQLFLAYCEQDVVVERMIGSVLRDLDEQEWDEYALNERIGDRGIPIDVPFACAARDYAEEVRADVDERISATTLGMVANSRQRKCRDAWLRSHLSDEQMKLVTVHRKDEKKISFDQAHRDALLAHPDLPPAVAEFTELVEEAGGATISKYTSMINRQIDGRVHGALMFNGAGQTGRFSSTGIQLHNLKREGVDNPDVMIDMVRNGYEIDDVTRTLAKLVRPTIANTLGLTWFDYSSVEGRIAPWLDGTALGEEKLAVYRDNIDPYVYNASKTFHVELDEVTTEQRQAGKLQELALQFLGGVGALKVMARGYGLVIEDDEAARLRDAWRQANPWALNIGGLMDRAALAAVSEPGTWFEAGRVAYAYDGGDWLWCRLPSLRLLAYFQPRLELVETPWGEERVSVTCLWGSHRPKVGESWPRRSMHPGIWLENCTQATAADLLREALLNCDDAGIPVVLHVHDEIVAEGECLDALRAAMLQLPAWASGLPLDGKGGTGERYGK